MAAPTPSPPQQPVESQPTSTSSSIEEALVRQVEWYLGRQNLKTDYFLKRHMDNDLWVPLDIILGFPKMQRIGILDPGVVATVLARGSVNIEVDLARNRVRPAWAKRFVLAITAIPQGTPASAIEELFIKVPETPRPLSLSPVSDKDGTWHAVFDDPDEARIASENISDLTIASTPPAKVAAHVFSSLDQSMFMPAAFPHSAVGIPVAPGQHPVGPSYFEIAGSSAGAGNIGSAPYATTVNPGMVPQFAIPLGPPGSPAYAYLPSPSYTGMGGQNVAGANSYPPASTGYLPPSRAYAPTGSYYVPPYSPQAAFDPVPVPSNHHNSTSTSHPPTSGPQSTQIQAGTVPAAAVAVDNLSPVGLPNKIPSGQASGSVATSSIANPVGDSALAADGTHPSMGNASKNYQNGRRGSQRHYHQNVASVAGMGAPVASGTGATVHNAQGMYLGAADNGNNVGFVGRNSGGHHGNRAHHANGGGNHGHFPSSSLHHPKHHSTNHMFGNPSFNVASRGKVSPNAGTPVPSDHAHHGAKGPRSHVGFPGGDHIVRQNALNKKHKKKATNSRHPQSNGNGISNSAGSPLNHQGFHTDGKPGSDNSEYLKDDTKKHIDNDSKRVLSELKKSNRSEPNLTAMNFPPLPGAVETGNVSLEKADKTSVGIKMSSNIDLSVSSSDVPDTIISSKSQNQSPLAAGTETTPLDMTVRDQEESYSHSAGASEVSFAGPGLSRKNSYGSDAMSGQNKDEKSSTVSDVSSTISSASTSHGTSNVAAGATPSVSPASSEAKTTPPELPISSTSGMTYAEILRTRSKKPVQSPASTTVNNVSDSPVPNAGGGGGAASSRLSGKGDGKSHGPSCVGSTGPSSNSREMVGTSKQHYGPRHASAQGKVCAASVNSKSVKTDGNGSTAAVPLSESSSQRQSESAKLQQPHKGDIPGGPRSVWANKPQSVLQAGSAPRGHPSKTSPVSVQGPAVLAPANAAGEGSSTGPSANNADSNASQQSGPVHSGYTARHQPNYKHGNTVASATVENIVPAAAHSEGSSCKSSSKSSLPNGNISGNGPKGVWGQKSKVWSRDLSNEKSSQRVDP